MEEEDNYHFSEVAPIQGFMNNAVEKDEDLHAKVMYAPSIVVRLALTFPFEGG